VTDLDPREANFRDALAMRAKLAEARIAQREQTLVDNADPATEAILADLVDQRVTASQPEPLVEHVELPDWPVDVLPDWVADHVTTTAARLQVPVDLCCQLAVGVLASITQGHVRVAVDDWAEPTALFCYCAMHSGAGKSPAEKAIVGPLREWERRRRADTADDHAIADAEWRVAQKRVKELESQHAKGACDLSEFREAAIRAADPRPAPFRLTVDDTTPERLTQLLAAHKRLALISTEAGLLDMVAGAYAANSQANLDVYLKAWAGETIIRDRKGGDGGPETTVVEDALLSVVLTIQPSVIEKYQQTQPELRGRGFFARFMPSMPTSLVGTRRFAKRGGPGPEAERYAARIADLADTLSGPEFTITLDDDAAEEFYGWCEQMEADLAPGRPLEPLHDASSKIRSSTLRLAAILTTASTQALTVDVATMRAAIRVGDYWVAHAMAVEGVVLGADSEDQHAVDVAVDILNWCRKHGRTEFTPRDVNLSLRRRYYHVEDLVPGLELLEAKGWLWFVHGELTDVGQRGVHVLARTRPEVLTRSVQNLTDSTSSRTRTSTRLEQGKTPPPPPKSTPTDEDPDPARVHVLVRELTEADLGPLL
jgi:hypothetical protein